MSDVSPFRITGLRATNFRPIGQLTLELRPLTVIVGPNSAGKSTLLQIPLLFRAMKEGELLRFFSKFGGFDHSVRYGSQVQELRIGISCGNGLEELHYDVNLFGERGSYFVSSETLRVQRRNTQVDLTGYNVYERRGQRATFVSKLEDKQKIVEIVNRQDPHVFSFGDHIPASKLLSQSWDHIFHFETWRLSLQEARRSQQLQLASMPAQDGSDLFSVLYTLMSEHPDRYSELMDAIRDAVPEFQELAFPIAGGGTINLTWKQSDIPQKLYALQLSDGILRFLWLITVLCTIPDGSLLLIDEPELSLHPQWLLLVSSIMRQASARATIIVTTQSAEFVKWIQPEELVIADLSTDGVTFTRASDKDDIQKWLNDFTLAEMWTMGELGGRR